ncbi:MAG TPA: polyprenyl synthetase family protein [Acidobacteriota bacterium]|jgi:geranylgeranyl pyrophosphate synthase/predicted secreted hydrolase|nr:polyprenyl synthetase family protein [Acidobacteriota bacterium]
MSRHLSAKTCVDSVKAAGRAARMADESAHRTARIEWWFVQGYYQGTRSGRRYFMSSIFALNFVPGSGKWRPGFSSLLSVLDPKTSQPETWSQIDGVVLNSSLEAEQDLRQLNLDRGALTLSLKEVAEHGPPRSVHLEKRPAKLHSKPFRFSWKDFSLAQSENKFCLQFIEPESRHVCRFDLVSLSPRMKVPRRGVLPMSYYTYPRLQLTGTANDEAVIGEAWLDHQWGGWNWFKADYTGRVLGWDWFGFNLDDGSDWVVVVHRDAETGQIVERHLTMRRGDSSSYASQNFEPVPTRYWQSQNTHIRHPVAWRIKESGLDADLTFEPIVDDQEIAVFGMARAIWEGAGHISGTVGGRSVSGRARGEFYGYGFIFDFHRLLETFAEKVDQRIEEFLPKKIDENQLQKYIGPPAWKREQEAYTPMLSQPVWDLLARRSKHWRPVLGVLMLEALGTPSAPYELLAILGAELIHTGALIIDDIEDSSQIRRGEECIHLRYGLSVAINAANTLYFLPLLHIMTHPHLSEKQRLRIAEILVTSYVRAHFGQALDIYWSRNMEAEKLTQWSNNNLGPKILQMYDDKTAALVEALAEIAAVIAGAEQSVSQACISFARAFGVSFQIVDDVLNFGESPEWTKTCGEDLMEGKLTYAIVRAIELLQNPDRKRLVDILCDPSLRKTGSGLREGIELVRHSGALDGCREEAERMFRTAWHRFSQKISPSDSKIMLHMLCLKTLHLSPER